MRPNWKQTHDRGVNLNYLEQQSNDGIVANIVSAYVSQNHIQPADLPKLIAVVHEAILKLQAPDAAISAEKLPEPAVSIKKSVTAEYIVCLEDGKKFKSLRRHLMSAYNMTPEAYREKWKLASDYPMVAPGYSATRSRLAKASGLGNVTRRTEDAAGPAAEIVAGERPEADVPDAAESAAEPKKTRGRPKKQNELARKAA